MPLPAAALAEARPTSKLHAADGDAGGGAIRGEGSGGLGAKGELLETVEDTCRPYNKRYIWAAADAADVTAAPTVETGNENAERRDFS